MRKIIITSLICSLILNHIAYARVSWNEYVTKAEVKQYLASASELLNKISTDNLREKLDKNPMLKQLKQKTQIEIRIQEEQRQNPSN